MKGIVYSVNIGEKKGESKKQVDEIILIENFGVKGDVHAGKDIKRQVSFLSWERIKEKNFCLKKKNFKIRPGDFAENITTEKIDLRKLKIGDKLKINDTIVEISQIGKECHIYCEIYKKIGSCIMPKEGVFGIVIKGGKLKKGDIIEVISKIDVGILTISDGCFKGEREDKSGKYLFEKCKEFGWNVLKYEIVPDEKEIIKVKLLEYSEKLNLILTTGGTGIGKRDITPEATKEIIEKEITGIGEILRIKGFEKSKFSVISRAVSGIKGETLIINLPGNLNAVIDGIEILRDIISHSIEMIRGFSHD